MKSLEVIDGKGWEGNFSPDVQAMAIKALEGGKVLYFPALAFSLDQDETSLLSPTILDPRAKNVSYDCHRQKLGGTVLQGEGAAPLQKMLLRYASSSRRFLNSLLPHYQSTVVQAKTSFRPVEIAGRQTSAMKDDTRLHVDAFPATPVRGRRILRFFTNINPDGKPRVWRTGEPFADVMAKINPRVSPFSPFVAWVFDKCGITKGRRSSYDQCMLKMHDTMKGDMEYQRQAPQEEVHFPPGSSWAVYTDLVSHAAMSGQHVLEQTYYLPPNAMHDPKTAPLAQLEAHLKRKLI
ncbi:MAG: Kdo hydroxylase family protein [Verrucomicrobia bacterium]|nr:Kdo hydroxylase family protein [Verrucomicrobiota bacterium]